MIFVKIFETIFAHALKTELKITYIEKVRFIKVNGLKLIQAELISFLHLKCVAAKIFELFCVAHLQNNERF